MLNTARAGHPCAKARPVLNRDGIVHAARGGVMEPDRDEISEARESTSSDTADKPGIADKTGIADGTDRSSRDYSEPFRILGSRGSVPGC